MTAARAVGMTRLMAVRSIVLPQAFRLVVPAWSNELVATIKYTAVVFLIAVPDLMGHAKKVSSDSFAPIEIYIFVALIYLIMVGIATISLGFLRNRMAIPGLSLEAEETH